MDAERIRKAREHLAAALVIHTDLLVRKASGVYVEDVTGGRTWISRRGSPRSTPGTTTPRVVEAIRRQAEAVLHGGCIFYHEPLVELPLRLAAVTPPGLDRFFFSNSGAEAVEGALKLARFVTGRQGHHRLFTLVPRPHLRCSHPHFHPRSRYPAPVFPRPPLRLPRPYPYCYRCAFGHRPDSCGTACFGFLGAPLPVPHRAGRSRLRRDRAGAGGRRLRSFPPRRSSGTCASSATGGNPCSSSMRCSREWARNRPVVACEHFGVAPRHHDGPPRGSPPGYR